MASQKFLLLLVLAVLFAVSCLVESVCYHDADCAPGKVCWLAAGTTQGQCRAQCLFDQDCGENEICDPASTICVAAECLLNSDCPNSFNCEQGRCVPSQILRCPDDMVIIENRFCVDRYEASRPDATAIHPGLDGSRAVSQPGVLPWTFGYMGSNQEALAACQAAGKTLCTESQWYQACSGPENSVYGYGDVYDPVICNGIDKYCRCGEGSSCQDRDPCPFPHCYHECGANFGPDATGAGAACTNAYGVFDMNGNVWEHVLDGDETRIRGGAYNCGDSEKLHRCSYIPGDWSPSARGFRCCSEGTL